MGDTFGDGELDEKPVHRVCLDDFKIDKYEVTQSQFKQVMGNNPSRFSTCGDCPVEQVTWLEAMEYCEKGDKRLPTEAEWEYAARSGGKSEKYSGGADIDSVAWYRNNSDGKTHPVGRKHANGLGLYDMSGNVWEWVSDRYDKGYYKRSPESNPKGPSKDERRTLRGGSWYFKPEYVRASDRYGFKPDVRGLFSGFRCSQ